MKIVSKSDTNGFFTGKDVISHIAVLYNSGQEVNTTGEHSKELRKKIVICIVLRWDFDLNLHVFQSPENSRVIH